jgi:hypothetical protein
MLEQLEVKAPAEIVTLRELESGATRATISGCSDSAFIPI